MRAHSTLLALGLLLAPHTRAHGVTITVGESAKSIMSRMQIRAFPGFTASPMADMGKTVQALGGAMGIALSPLPSRPHCWGTPDSAHVVQYSEGSGVLRYRRRLPADSLPDRVFPEGLNRRAESVRDALLGAGARQYHFERMFGTVLAEPGRAARVTTRTYRYRQVIEGMAVLDDRGLLTLEFDPCRDIVSAQIPAVALVRDTVATCPVLLEQRVIEVVGQTSKIQHGREELVAAAARVMAVAPALVPAIASGGCRLVPSLCVMVDHSDGAGRSVRKEHIVALAE